MRKEQFNLQLISQESTMNLMNVLLTLPLKTDSLAALLRDHG